MDQGVVLQEIQQETFANCLKLHNKWLIIGGQRKATRIFDIATGQLIDRVNSETLGKCRNFDISLGFYLNQRSLEYQIIPSQC